MIRGLYTSASAMLAGVMQTDVVTNNIANVNTAGYKKDLAVSKEFREMLIYRINDPNVSKFLPMPPFPPGMIPIGYLGTGAMVDNIYTSQEQGSVRNTGNPFDLAIMGEGFFTVDTSGGLRYTRNGSFALNANRELVTITGDRVLGENGPVILEGKKINVDEAGGIYSDGVFVDRLRMATFADLNVLEKQGDSYYKPSQTADELPMKGIVQQGFIEGANVNTVKEMVNLINVFRTYEANQKIVLAQDETLGKAVNEVGKTS
jgi:flagellar basal-body rod protein FlgG